MKELIVFRSAAEARKAGFIGLRHPQMPDAYVWFPALGVAGLALRPVQRVTLPYGMAYKMVGDEGRLGDILRKRQMVYGAEAVWIEV